MKQDDMDNFYQIHSLCSLLHLMYFKGIAAQPTYLELNFLRAYYILSIKQKLSII